MTLKKAAEYALKALNPPPKMSHWEVVEMQARATMMLKNALAKAKESERKTNAGDKHD